MRGHVGGHRKPGIRLLCLFLMVGCSSLDINIVEQEFQDYSAAVSGSGIGRSVGKVLPRSATRIRERRNTNTGEVWLRFDYVDGPAAEWMTRVESVDLAAIIGSQQLALAVREGWWPPQGGDHTIDLYRCIWQTQTTGGMPYGGVGVLAADSSVRVAYYIHGPRERASRK